MSKIKILNANENGYFANNQIDIADTIPTTGTYKVGDIIIKSTQVAGEAIGWICVKAGTPGTWHEFGGMLTDDREIVINPGSVGMTELATELKLKFTLADALSTSVDQLRSELDGFKDEVDEKINNIDFSAFATKAEVEEFDNYAYNQIVSINESVDNLNGNIGNMTKLQTTDKNNLVDAINEVFQLGNNVKQNLVDTLVAKGVSCSTSNSFDELFKFMEEMTVLPSWVGNLGTVISGGLMPTGRRFPTSAVLGTDIYVIGGYTGSASNVNQKYDTITNTWTTMKALTVSTYGASAVACNGLIYHLGGYSYTTSHYVYSPSTNTWTGKTALPNAKQYSAAVEVDGKIYIAQGNNTYNMVYDPTTNAWTQLTRNGSTNAGNYPSVAYYDGNIYYMGGASYPTYAYKYNIANDTWSSAKAITTGFYRAGQQGMFYNGKIYFMGGTSNGSTSSSIFRYDPVANTWEILSTTMPIATYGPTTQIVNGRMYCIGGYASTYAQNNQILIIDQ